MGGKLTGIDLRADEHREVARLLQRHLPDTEVWAYGSRVKGIARPASDLDLVTFASAGQQEAVSRLREAFDESSLPFRVDLFVWDKVPEEFRKNIEEARVVVQEKEKKNLPKGWQQVILGDVITINDATYSSKDKWSFINYLDTGNLTNGEISEVKRFTIGTDKIPSRAKRKIQPGDIVYSTVRPNQKHFGIIKNLPENLLVSTAFVTIRGKKEKADTNFVYFLLTQRETIEILQTIGEHSTSAYPSIKSSDIEVLKFNLPPLPEQKAIAHILGSLDDKIELNRRMNETLEAMAQALFKSWFVDFDPVIDNALAAGNTIPDELKEKTCLRRSFGRQATIRQGLDDKQKSLPDDIRRLFPSEFAYTEEMGWIPKGWEVGPLRLIATYCSDRIPTSELTLENYISTENMLAEKKGICTAAKLPSVKTTSSYQSGNALVSNIRPYFKKIWFAEGSGGCSNDILNFTVKELNTEEYLLNLLWQDTFFDYMMTTAKGSKMPRGDKDAIMNWKVIIPPVKSRRLFAETVRGFYKQISGKYKINTVLTQFSDKLLIRLLSGDIRIPSAKSAYGGKND